MVKKKKKKKNLPPAQETQVQSLHLEDPLEKDMATYSIILAWRIPWTKKPGGLPWVSKEVDTTETSVCIFFFF